MIENIIILVFSIIGTAYIMYKLNEYGEFKMRSEYLKDQYKFGKHENNK